MHDPRILEKFGCTTDRLRKIFTSKDVPETTVPDSSVENAKPLEKPKCDGDIRKRFEARIRSRILDGIGVNCQNSRPYQAVDIGWDAPPIQKETIPLMLWAQGKIDTQRLRSSLEKECGTAGADRFFQKTPQKDVLMVNTTRICDISVDLLKSYVTRRHAAMDALWANLWPLFKYDPRGVDDVTELRADALTQRVDIMSDDYNYRHFWGQCRRQMLLYGWSMAFPRAAWDRQISWRMEPSNTGEPSNEPESYVEREGVDFVNPHPSRIFWDVSSPLANINTNTGPKWVGYWDIIKYGDLIAPNSEYYNLQETFISSGWIALATQFSDFFSYYYDPTRITFGDLREDPTIRNERIAKIGRFTSEGADQGVLLTQYFEYINPLQEGIGTYDANVWVRLIVAGDCTVIGGEFLPSLPGAYGAINWNDGRLANQSMGMALLGIQDHASNIVSSMLMQLRASLIQLWMIDRDSVDPEIIEQFKKNAANRDWWVDPKLLIYSASKLRDMGILDPSQAFKIIQPNIQNALDNGLKQLAQLLNLADRLLILSPNELGQPNPREVSAREVNEVSTSVQSIYSFINEGPREQVAAAKRLIYESLVMCAKQDFRVPIMKRYTVDVIKRAGFKVPPDVRLPVKKTKPGQPPEETTDDDIVPLKTPVMGNLRDLIYDYYFDSRDGTERVLNTQGAQVVMQLVTAIMKVPALMQKMGSDNLMEAFNVVIRMSGAPWNFQFDVPVGGDDSMQPAEDPQMQQLIQGQQATAAEVQRIITILAQTLHIPPAMLAPPAAGGQPGQPPGGPPPGPQPAQPAAAPPGPPGKPAAPGRPHPPAKGPALGPPPPAAGTPSPSPATTLAEPQQAAA